MLGNKKIWYGLGLDNKSLQADAEKSKNILRGISEKATVEGQKIDQTFKTISRTVGVVFSTGVLASFTKKIAETRGEFQQLEVAFTTMLGSKQKADALMARTIDFAAKTPFDLRGVAQGTKQLLAYGSASETVTDELGMLGNIASGLSIPLNDIVYLYGTTRTQGRLFTQDLRQFMGRGIPLAEELAKQFNVTKDEVGALVTAGKVGFKEVEIALQNMTSEGGKFYNLMEEQSKTITGKISNLGDAMDQMFNKIGMSNEGIISDALDGTIELVENYEEVGRIIAELIGIYGTYRAALIVTATANTLVAEATVGFTIAQMAQYRWTLLTTKAQKALNFTMLANPYVALAVGLTSLVYLLYKLNTATNLAEQAQENFNNKMEERKDLAKQEIDAVNENISVLKDELSTRSEKQKALETLQSKYPKYFDNLDIENAKYLNIKEVLKSVNEELERKNLLSDKEKLNSVQTELDELNANPQKKIDEINSAVRKANISNGNIGAGLSSLFGLGELEVDEYREQLEKKIELYGKNVKEAERLKFESLSNEDKINSKTKENAEFVRLLESTRLKPEEKEIIKNNIRENEKLIQGYKDAEKGKETTNRSDLAKKISETQTKIDQLRSKSTKGISKDEEKELEGYITTLGDLQKRLSNLKGNKSNKSTTTSEDEDAKRLQLEKENNRRLEDEKYESSLRQVEIEKTGAEKSLAILKLENDRKLQLLKREQEDVISGIEKDKAIDLKTNPGNEDKWNAKIEQYNNLWNDARTQQEEINRRSTEEFLNEQLNQYQTYAEKKKELEEKANQKISDYKFLGKEKGDENLYADKIQLVREELQKALEDLEKVSNDSVIDRLFSDYSTMTLDEMKKLLVEAETFYTKMPKTDENVQKLKDIREQIDNLKISIDTVENIFKRLGANIKDVFSGKLDKTEFSKKLKEIQSDFNDISGAVQFFSDSLATLGEATGSKALGEIAKGMNDVLEVSNKTMEGAVQGAKIGGQVGAIVGATIGLVSSVANVLARRKDEKKEKEIVRLEKQVKGLQKAYDALGKSIEKAYGTDATALIDQQDENLRNQKALLEAQIKKEESKKKTDKSRIEQWKEEIEAIDELLASSSDKKREAIIGQDIKSAIDEFASAYISAWEAGEDKAKAMNDVVKNLIKSAVNQFISARMSGEVEKFYNYLATAMEDGILTVAEKNVLDQLESSINDKLSNLSETLNDYVIDTDIENTREATQKGFATMSQDTADELNGRFTVIQGHTFAISEAMVSMRDLGEKQLKYLGLISHNTSKLNKMEQDITAMKSGIDDINTLGIKLR